MSISRWLTWLIFRLTEMEPVSVKCTNCCALNFVLVNSSHNSNSICEWAKWQVSPILQLLPLYWCQHISILHPLGSRIRTIFSWNKLRLGRPEGSFEVFLKRNPPPYRLTIPLRKYVESNPFKWPENYITYPFMPIYYISYIAVWCGLVRIHLFLTTFNKGLSMIFWLLKISIDRNDYLESSDEQIFR